MFYSRSEAEVFASVAMFDYVIYMCFSYRICFCSR